MSSDSFCASLKDIHPIAKQESLLVESYALELEPGIDPRAVSVDSVKRQRDRLAVSVASVKIDQKKKNKKNKNNFIIWNIAYFLRSDVVRYHVGHRNRYHFDLSVCLACDRKI